MKIKITQEDINNGIKHDGHYCPLALAVKRVLLKEDVFVSPSAVITNKHIFALPIIAKIFIEKFDEKGKNIVFPFEFELKNECT